MSDNEEINSQWDVDTRTSSSAGIDFDMTMLLVTDSKPGYLTFDPEDRHNVREVIIELVGEIERLQTALINMGEQVVATGAITPYEYGDDYWAEHNVMEYWAKPDDQDALWREGWRPI